MPVADAELVMGAWTEYTGLRFAFFLLAEYAGIVVMSLLVATLWLGGWHGPFEDSLGWLWTLLKGFAVAVVVIWVRSPGRGCGRTGCSGSPGSGSCRSRSAADADRRRGGDGLVSGLPGILKGLATTARRPAADAHQEYPDVTDLRRGAGG